MTTETSPKDAKTGMTNASTPWLISDGLRSHNVSKNKRLKPLARWTPWVNCWEFESVGLSLIDAARTLPPRAGSKRRRHDDNPQQLVSLQNALSRVTVWKVRADNSRLPHAVESSHQLAQCLWNDYASVRGAEELRLSYSCAVLRAINGLADTMQQQRSNAASVAVLCSDIGIPSWLVDVRHEATHNQMPTLSVLRLAASTLLEYFHQEYWLPEIQFMTSGTQPQQAGDVATTQNTTISGTTTLVKHLEDYQRQQTKIFMTRSSSVPQNPTPPKKTNSSGGNNKTTKKPAANKVVSIGLDVININNSNNDSDDDSDEEMYLDGLLDSTGSGGFWSPPSTSLGTNSNRFAALQASSSKAKSKKGKKPKLSQQQKNTTKQQRNGNTATKSNEPSAHDHAKQFAKAGMHHLELAQRTALLFLVWGGVSVGNGENQSVQQPQGALIPLCSTEFPETGEGIKRVRQHYSILLTVLGKEWPGFLTTLMIHLIDCILTIETSQVNARDATEAPGIGGGDAPKETMDGKALSSTDNNKEATPQRKLFFLESWVQYLVSHEFVIKIHPSEAKGNTRATKSIRLPPAPWESLEKMWYPLNSLCDRLLSSPAIASANQEGEGGGARTRKRGLTSQRLADLFSQVLGQNRLPYFGVVYEQSSADINSLFEAPLGKAKDDDMVTSSPEFGESSDKVTLSLDEMEAILSSDGTKKEAVPDSALVPPATVKAALGVATLDPNETAKQQSKRPAWVRCTVWEPCSIGSLPGHPCSS